MNFTSSKLARSKIRDQEIDPLKCSKFNFEIFSKIPIKQKPSNLFRTWEKFLENKFFVLFSWSEIFETRALEFIPLVT